MKAVLLSAGLGIRLRPITNTIPKCLVPIHGVPLLGIWLSQLFFSPFITRAIVNLHYLPALVEDYIKTSQWQENIDLFQEPILLGTGGTLRAARKLLGNEPILVVHADNLSNINLKAFYAAHLNRPDGCIMTMALFNTDNPQSCGIVELDDNKCVISMHEKIENPPSTLANAAVYIMEPEVLDQLKTIKSPKIDISTEVIPLLMGKVYTYEITGYHRDIGNPEALAQAHLDLKPSHIVSLLTSDEEIFL